jgi:hypothetical protein
MKQHTEKQYNLRKESEIKLHIICLQNVWNLLKIVYFTINYKEKDGKM